jgi:hypothetical protein
MAVELNLREQVLARILQMPEEEVAQVAAFMADLEEDDELDHALIESRKEEPTISFDEFLEKSGFTREQLAAIPLDEGLTQ